MLPISKQQEIEHVRVEIFQSITYSLINNKSPQSCYSVNTSSTAREKTTEKICKYTSEHDKRRRFTNVSLPDFFLRGRGVCIEAILFPSSPVFLFPDCLIHLFPCSPVSLLPCSRVPFICSGSHPEYRIGFILPARGFTTAIYYPHKPWVATEILVWFLTRWAWLHLQ